MSKSEAEVLADVLLAGTSATTRLWRNQCGSALVADKPGQKRMINFGVSSPGGSDCIGLRSVVFCAVEVKREVGGRVSDDQKQFLGLVRDFGGLCGVARSADEARAILGIEG
jgi:hypothetical protein